MTTEEKNQMTKMSDKIDKVDDKLNDVLTLLKGDEFGSSDGLVAEIKDIKKRVRLLEDIKKKVIWIASGAGVAGGFLIDKLVAFFKAVFLSALLLLVISCNLFKKVTTSTEKTTSVEVLKSDVSVNTQITERSIHNELEKRAIWIDLTSLLEADEIFIDNGKIWAKGTAKYSFNLKDSSLLVTDKKTENNIVIDQKQKVKADEKSSNTTSVSKTESTPSGKGVLYGTLAFVVVICFLLYFGIGSKI